MYSKPPRGLQNSAGLKPVASASLEDITLHLLAVAWRGGIPLCSPQEVPVPIQATGAAHLDQKFKRRQRNEKEEEGRSWCQEGSQVGTRSPVPGKHVTPEAEATRVQERKGSKQSGSVHPGSPGLSGYFPFLKIINRNPRCGTFAGGGAGAECWLSNNPNSEQWKQELRWVFVHPRSPKLTRKPATSGEWMRKMWRRGGLIHLKNRAAEVAR